MTIHVCVLLACDFGGQVAMMEAAAATEQLHVCPIFGFGETEVFDNIRIPQAFQEAAVKLLRANVIYCPYGVWGMPGFPRPVQLTFGVGNPIEVPKVANPTAEQVAVVHRRYMHELVATFERFKSQTCQPTSSVALTPELPLLSESEFAAAWEAVKDQRNATPRKYRPEKNYVESALVAAFFLSCFVLLCWIAYGVAAQ